MALKLNAPHEYIKIDGHELPHFKEFFGRNVDTAPQVTSSGRVLMSLAQIMQRRLNVRDIRGTDAEVISAWMDNYFDTSDLNARRGDEFKIVLSTYADGSVTSLGKKYLALINPSEELVDGAVNLEVNDRYDGLQGDGVFVVQGKKNLASVVDEPQTQKQAKDSLFWRIALKHPDEVPKAFAIPGLHEEAISYIFAEYKNRFARNTPVEDIKAMGVFPGSVPKGSAELRAWYVDGLEPRSCALGRLSLGDTGRFLGIAPEALSALGKSASNTGRTI